jgi:transcriptional regulator with XRE-family HTH domain
VDEDVQDSSYSRQVGLRLRAVRRQKRMSLHDVEVGSTKEFKASVLGAYERGERAISVPRLQRLAAYYGVPVDSLLPPVQLARAEGEDHEADQAVPTRGLTIDLTRLEHLSSHEAAMLSRYVSMIRSQRGAASGTSLTIRREDLNAIAVLLETDPDSVKLRLEQPAAH